MVLLRCRFWYRRFFCCLVVIVSAAATGAASFALPLFHRFQFAPNGVCISPKYFVSSSNQQNPQQQQKNKVGEEEEEQRQLQYFTLRNVPGTGDCMFLAVALAAAASMGLGGNDALLRAVARETRAVVASVLEVPDGALLVSESSDRQQQPQQHPIAVSTSALLLQATKQLQLASTDEYLKLLRTEGRHGGLYGGGPELTVLANVLRRPISIYELLDVDDSTPAAAAPAAAADRASPTTTSSDEDDESKSETTTSTTTNPPELQRIVCMGTFGAGRFADPVETIPNSAVLQALPVGAYSWHLHILVVDVVLVDDVVTVGGGGGRETTSTPSTPGTPSSLKDADGEDAAANKTIVRRKRRAKHACVLLPQRMRPPSSRSD
jgi:hypothetical protein